MATTSTDNATQTSPKEPTATSQSRSWPTDYLPGLRSRHPTTLSTSQHSNGLRPDEDGHSWRRIQPMSRHSGDSVSSFFTGLFGTIIAVSTLGASITFSYVISNNLTPPRNHPLFGIDEIQLFLSISWLLFLLALAFASTGSTLLTFFRDHWKADWDCKNGDQSRLSVQVYAAFASGLLSTLVIAAFVFLCLVVIAYSPVIGWLALGFTAAFGLAIECSVAYQAPWPWRKETFSKPVKTPTGRSGVSNA